MISPLYIVVMFFFSVPLETAKPSNLNCGVPSASSENTTLPSTVNEALSSKKPFNAKPPSVMYSNVNFTFLPLNWLKSYDLSIHFPFVESAFPLFAFSPSLSISVFDHLLLQHVLQGSHTLLQFHIKI